MPRDMYRDLVACFAWKHVMLGFQSLAIRLVEARLLVVHVASSRRLHREKAKDGRVDASGYVRPFHPKIAVSSVLGPRGIVVF
jgi:hypothetical protein